MEKVDLFKWEDFLHSIKKNKLKNIVIVLICVIIGTVYAFYKPVKYDSNAQIILKSSTVVDYGSLLLVMEQAKQSTNLSNVEFHVERESGVVRLSTEGETAEMAQAKTQAALDNFVEYIEKDNKARFAEGMPQSIQMAKTAMNAANAALRIAQANNAADNEVEDLKQDAQVKENVYTKLLTEYTHSFYDVEVLSKPNLPDKPVNPRRDNNIFAGLALGLLLVFGYNIKWCKRS